MSVCAFLCVPHCDSVVSKFACSNMFVCLSVICVCIVLFVPVRCCVFVYVNFASLIFTISCLVFMCVCILFLFTLSMRRILCCDVIF